MPSVNFHTIRSGVRGPGPSLYLLHGASRLVAMNKSLAQMNKPSDVDKATKKYSALRDASRAERAEFYFDPFCQLAPAATRLGPSSVPNVARTQIIANSKSPCIFWTTAEV